MTVHIEQRPHAHRTLAVGAAAVALSALAGAVGLIGGGLSIGLRLNERLPLGSPVLGGLALAAVVGVPFSVLATRAWKADSRTGFTALVAGAVLISWLVVELAFIRELSFFHPLFVAVALTFMAAGRAVAHGRGFSDPATYVDEAAVHRFLSKQRIAVVGASADPAKFGHTVFVTLADHGYDAVPVNLLAANVAGVSCHSSVADIDPPCDGAIIMLTGPSALAAVHDCIAAKVQKVWLFRGVGSPGALSNEAVQACRTAGVDVVAGACPLMFLQPTAKVHRLHLAIRRLDGSLAEASA